jgi:Tfp pilus assembly protein PilV
MGRRSEGVMDNGLLIPLAVFAMVVLIVGITGLAKLHDKEIEIQQSLHSEQLEHQRKMKELEQEMERIKAGG